jgi:uncharacterized protein (TIGR04141 family)
MVSFRQGASDGYRPRRHRWRVLRSRREAKDVFKSLLARTLSRASVVKKAKEKSLQSLNIFLMKGEVQELEGAVPHKALLERIDLRAVVGSPALLFIKRPKSRPPAWCRFFDGIVDAHAFGRVSNAAAVALVLIEDRIFGLSFGQGRFLLDVDKIEERFGLKVCLNSIDVKAIRSIDKRSFDALLTHSRVQTSKAASITDFGLDVEQDLLRAATGKPVDTSLGDRMSGLDSLSVAARAMLSDLKELLPRYLRAGRSTKYKKSYPWVDQIEEIRGDAEIDVLDARMVAAFKSLDAHRLWMALPEVVDWVRVQGFRHSRRHEAPLHYDAHLDEWIIDAIKDKDVTLDLLTRKRVYASDADGHDVADWPVYKCLYCELEEGNATCLLSAGRWYRVKRNLVEQVNESFDKLRRRPARMPVYSHESEAAYNMDVAAKAPHEFSCHDRKLVTVPSSGSPIEICDLYSRDGELIHVKRYAASSVLSHHFAQAVISAEALSLDKSARIAFAKQVSSPQHFNPQAFKSEEHAVVLAIVSDQVGELTLPFFARLNLRHTERRLRSMGFSLVLAKIEVAAETTRLKRYVTKA